jgi:hypothetical protein
VCPKPARAPSVLKVAAGTDLPNLPLFRGDPHFAALRNNPGFLRLLAGFGLTGVFWAGGSEREFTLEGSWYADERVRAAANRDLAAAGGIGQSFEIVTRNGSWEIPNELERACKFYIARAYWFSWRGIQALAYGGDFACQVRMEANICCVAGMAKSPILMNVAVRRADKSMA